MRYCVQADVTINKKIEKKEKQKMEKDGMTKLEMGVGIIKDEKKIALTLPASHVLALTAFMGTMFIKSEEELTDLMVELSGVESDDLKEGCRGSVEYAGQLLGVLKLATGKYIEVCGLLDEEDEEGKENGNEESPHES